MLTKEEARFYPKRNIITRAIGIRGTVEPDMRSINLRQGDFLVLCSDGLTDMVSDDDIRDILTGGDEPVEVRCKALLDLANRKGGRDNITVVVIFWDEGAATPTKFH